MAGAIDDNQKGIVQEAVRQFVDAQMQGQQLDIDEFVKKYPGLDSKIREGIKELQKIPGLDSKIREGIKELQKIDALFDSLVRTDETDFEEAAAGQDIVGRKVGSFEIVEMIGRGGMGVVYLARDTKLDRSVAVKSIPAKLADDSTTRMRFHREAKLLASLNHPNIAAIHEIIEQEEGAGYLVLEYVPGQSLAQRIAHKPLKLEEALSIAQQVAEAVSAAHKKGVIHRDLKPGNIKITPEGKVKVLDFGLAKAPVSEGKKSDITATEPGRVIGTPAYMSPEQTRGNPVDHRSDIWSFACILYEMLTGHSPFESDTATDTIGKLCPRKPLQISVSFSAAVWRRTLTNGLETLKMQQSKSKKH
jgi:serine/threonine protein kinase